MPSYVSHTLMARSVYKVINKNVSLNYLLTFSLGGDLCKYSSCRKESHTIKQEEFIYNMCDYIKNNNLINNKDIMGVLYGHICHYIMDDLMHPLIWSISKKCVKNKRNHTLIEGYYDSYFVNKIYNISIDKYDNNSLFKGRITKEIKDMINYVYEKTYNVKNISFYYKLNIFLYKKIKYLYKIFGIKLLKKYSGFNKFILDNKDINLFENIDELYNESIKRSLIYIKKINKYLGKNNV